MFFFFYAIAPTAGNHTVADRSGVLCTRFNYPQHGMSKRMSNAGADAECGLRVRANRTDHTYTEDTPLCHSGGDAQGSIRCYVPLSQAAGYARAATVDRTPTSLIRTALARSSCTRSGDEVVAQLALTSARALLVAYAFSRSSCSRSVQVTCQKKKRKKNVYTK